MSAFDNASQKLVDLAFYALEHGVDCVRDGEPLIPFVVAEDENGGSKLHRFAAPKTDEGVEEARNYLKTHTSEFVRYALAYDGYLTVDNEKSDAIIIEACEKNMPRAFTLTQRYKPQTESQQFSEIGEVAFTGETSALF